MGARQTGKTTLAQMLTGQFDRKDTLWLYGDDFDTQKRFANPNREALRLIIGDAKLLVIDEAQRIENIGLVIKIIIDQLKDVKVVATGSSSFELANKVNEPLTGRKWEYKVFPFSFKEMVDHHGYITEERLLEQRLIYGYYPEVVNNIGRERETLKQLANDYLYKDILSWKFIKKPDGLEKLLQALAFQVGNMVSYNELGQISGLDNQTVEAYISILEQSFIVFRLGSLSRNLRNELKKTRKIYFYDNGLRNAIINQFNPIELRTDIGALWENFLVSERQKFNANSKRYANVFFWRTLQQKELDYVEEYGGAFHCYEFKWNNKKGKTQIPSDFPKAYEVAEFNVITRENMHSFLLD